ncbi:hypothetical protein BJ960_000207 [Leucobacter aridicollis]|uniref:Uncharacterized protein n=1 Tax=Leucobacter aridicollis TaxID=283878 RepID=A0A852RAJ2_9MICO|nr:hypothetical protein [Leucobacter aridicollis]
MPVITLSMPATWPAAPSQSVAEAVAGALDLGAGDVIVLETPYVDSARSGPLKSSGHWVLVTLRGSDRGVDARDRAVTAASAAVATWAERSGVGLEGVWCEWLLS